MANIFSKIKDAVQNLAGPDGLFSTSVLVSEQKINAALDGLVTNDLHLRNIAIKCGKATATVSVHASYMVEFVAYLDVKPLFIKTGEGRLNIGLKRISRVHLRPFRSLLKPLAAVLEAYVLPLTGFDAVEFASRNISFLESDGNNILLSFPLEMILDELKLPRQAIHLKNAIQFHDFEFVEGGVRVNLKILPQLFQ